LNSKCWFQISSGSGPEECCRTVGSVFNEISKEVKESRISVSLVHAVPTAIEGNYKSMLLSLEGESGSLDVFCRSWQGTIQWIWKSDYRPHHKRKNWFVSVEALNPVPDAYNWKKDEIRIETCRSSGPGGQHVNKTESAVRVIHLPTGITALAGEERSQHMNKKLALARLDALLLRQHRERQQKAQKGRWQKHRQLERGNSIRVYRGSEFSRIDREERGATHD
jgi:peptide chain release factor